MKYVPALTQVMEQIHASCFTIPRPWTEQEFSDLLETPRVFFAMRAPPDKYLLACSCGFSIGQWLDDTQAELLTLAVIPDEQCKGYGRAMLFDFIVGVEVRGGRFIFLEVAENNAPALHLYEAAGFKPIGVRKGYYPAPDNTEAPRIDAIQMRLDIKN